LRLPLGALWRHRTAAPHLVLNRIVLNRIELNRPSDLTGAARSASHRYSRGGAQSAHRAVAEHDVAAMRTRDVAGDGKPKPGAALILVAGVIQPQERLEHFLAHVGGNARSVVVDGDREIAVIAVAGD